MAQRGSPAALLDLLPLNGLAVVAAEQCEDGKLQHDSIMARSILGASTARFCRAVASPGAMPPLFSAYEKAALTSQ
eukprot:CAMPEP_0117653976 /NCGR_PEP_ID=MMETSP0804-20121206/3491_1 /TAXON_ID=1074897 /ORGANISM="Tetraselmis astigmatica, Strain CCMP880" /LENGTH=75 /DNA_ID=CAMNT_0005460213 /DNA_START=870 /DNA_END=1098 /DNA_ORIENTATION=-